MTPLPILLLTALAALTLTSARPAHLANRRVRHPSLKRYDDVPVAPYTTSAPTDESSKRSGGDPRDVPIALDARGLPITATTTITMDVTSTMTIWDIVQPTGGQVVVGGGGGGDGVAGVSASVTSVSGTTTSGSSSIQTAYLSSATMSVSIQDVSPTPTTNASYSTIVLSSASESLPTSTGNSSSSSILLSAVSSDILPTSTSNGSFSSVILSFTPTAVSSEVASTSTSNTSIPIITSASSATNVAVFSPNATETSSSVTSTLGVDSFNATGTVSASYVASLASSTASDAPLATPSALPETAPVNGTLELNGTAVVSPTTMPTAIVSTMETSAAANASIQIATATSDISSFITEMSSAVPQVVNVTDTATTMTSTASSFAVSSFASSGVAAESLATSSISATDSLATASTSMTLSAESSAVTLATSSAILSAAAITTAASSTTAISSSAAVTTLTSSTTTASAAAATGSGLSTADLPTQMVAAYYPDWTASDLPPANVDWDLYDCVDFAFALPNSNFGLTFTQWNSETSLTSLVAYGHAAGKKVRLSIGGWTGSVYFSEAVSTEANRAIFAANILATYTAFDLDGIDIDWEYPGVQGSGSNIVSGSDSANFLLFLNTLRATLPPTAILSAATQVWPFADSSGNPMSDVSGFAEVLDWVLVMNYDIWGSSPTPGPNAPLSDGCGDSQQPLANAYAAVSSWTTAGMPAGQIMLGIPAYGYLQISSATALVDRKRSTDVILYNADAGSTNGQIDFNSIVSQGALVLESDGTYGAAGGFVREWDSCSSTPWLKSTSSGQIVTYDDPVSLSLKAQFARQAGLRGTNMWDMAGDTSNWALTQAVRSGLGLS